MFRGNHPAKVDEKGRLKLPSPSSSCWTPQHVTQFYVTSSDGKSAEIWPLPEWEKREAQLAEPAPWTTRCKKYLNLTSYYGQQVEMDSQARMLLAQILRRRGQARRRSDGVGQDDLPRSSQPGGLRERSGRPTNDGRGSQGSGRDSEPARLKLKPLRGSA